MKYNYPPLIGICKNCLGCNKLENPNFRGVWKCKYNEKEKNMDLDDDELKATKKINGVAKKDVYWRMKQLEIHIANKLDDEQWNNWQEVLKYIKELEEI